jgi:hypothetical protein
MTDITKILNSTSTNAEIIQKCYSIYPTDTFDFQGQTFTRGMYVRLVTLQNKSFEGEFIGISKDNMLCIATQDVVVAHQISNIRELINLEDI